MGKVEADLPHTYFTGVRAKWLPLYRQLYELAAGQLEPFEAQATDKGMLWKHTSTFASISAVAACMRIELFSDAVHDEWRPAKVLQTSRHRVAHTFEVADGDAFPALLERIADSYALTNTGRAPGRTPKAEAVTVEAFIAMYPPEVQEIMQQLRRVIRQEAPLAQEKISWGMPTYYQGENLVHFAPAKAHMGFFPSPEVVEAFADRLGEYSFSKGTVRFPYTKPMPYALIADMVRLRVAQLAD